MNDLANLTGQPGTLSAGGETHRCGPLTVADWGVLQAWVDAQFPDPFETVDRVIAARAEAGKPMPVAQQQHLLSHALELAGRPKKLIGTDEADALLQSAEGMVEMLLLGIRMHEPGFTRDDARAFHRKLSVVQLYKLMMISHANLVMGDGADPLGRGTAAAAPAVPAGTGGNSTTGA